MTGGHNREMQVLVLAVTPGDAELSDTIFREAGLATAICTGMDELCERIREGAGAIVLTEAGLAARQAASCLADAVGQQPAWSEVPIILLCGNGADSPLAAWAMGHLGSVTVLERPVRITTIVSVVRTALAARCRQYELRDQLHALRRSEDSLRSANERLKLLWEAAGILLSGNAPEEMLGQLFEKIAPTLQLDAYVNFMVDGDGEDEALHLHSCRGLPQEAIETLSTLRFHEAICGAVAAQRKPITASNVQQSDDPRTRLVKSLGMCVYSCNPLLAGDRLIGTLSFASRRRDRFDQHEIEFLETISQYVTLAYQRTQFIQALRENDRRKDEFLATLAHELRNPLAPIRAGLDLMKVAGDDAQVMEEIHPTLQRQVGQMVHLIDDLMDVSRITRGKIALKTSRVELAPIVRNAVDATRGFFEEAGQQFQLSLPAEDVFLEADPHRLVQVLSNLLNNAAKYTPAGGEISLSAARDGDDVVLTVRDTGIGIPADMQHRVFEMFGQIHDRQGDGDAGLGIGLTLVKSLVEMHHGAIDFESDGKDCGSTFRVRLPMLADGSSRNSAQVSTAAESHAPGNQRVLIVDDNLAAADLLSAAVKRLGNEVRTASDGLQACGVAETFRPSVIIMDLGMPKMDGYQTARYIRQQPWGEDVMLIALSGWGQAEDQRRTKEAGFDGHLVKPAEMAVVKELLAQAKTRSC